VSIWVIVGPLALAGLTLAYRHWPRSPEATYALRFAELRADMAARGLTEQQKMEEMAFRRAMAVLRRRSTEAVLKDPTGHLRGMISTIAVEIAKTMADKDVARRFLKVVQDAPFSDILYRDAMKAVAGAKRALPSRAPVTDDDIAAVSTK